MKYKTHVITLAIAINSLWASFSCTKPEPSSRQTEAATGTTGQAAAPTETQRKPVNNIVLVHGAFADGTSWGKVIPILEERGFHVVAVQNPLTSLSDDVNATRRIIAMQDGSVILVGHSWGGAVITQVDDPKVAGLVYVAAYVPDVGKSANETSG